MSKVSVNDVQDFWENNPLSAAAIPFEPGTPEFFERHTRMRRKIESDEFLKEVYEPYDYEGENVLDVGCGTGFVVELYARRGAAVSGVDIAHRSVELTQKRLAMSSLTANVQQANAEKLPFQDNYFDLVTSYGVLHHTPNTKAAIQEVLRVLKPGGKTIMMFYNRNSFAYQILFRLKRWIQPGWRGKTAQDQVNAVDGPQNPLGKVYSRHELRTLLSDFEIEEFQTATIFFRWRFLMPHFLVRYIENRWGWHLYVKAHKPTAGRAL